MCEKKSVISTWRLNTGINIYRCYYRGKPGHWLSKKMRKLLLCWVDGTAMCGIVFLGNTIMSNLLLEKPSKSLMSTYYFRKMFPALEERWVNELIKRMWKIQMLICCVQDKRPLDEISKEYIIQMQKSHWSNRDSNK